MAEEILKIDHVSKVYRLGMIGGTTLREELQRKRARRKGLEDPTSIVGTTIAGNIGDEFYALDDVSFTVRHGERIGIIGHNGAGKSTLLKLICRITAPSAGSIEMNGRIASMLEVGTGFHPELSGRENIYMNGAILGMTKAEIDRKIEDIIDFSECRQFIDTPVKRYSSGMYVKLAFSVASHLDSEIMIMDEVLAVGDMAFQRKCIGKMSQVSQSEGRTILYVSHNMNTIRQLCNRCIVLDHGHLVFDGEVEEAISIYLGINSSELDICYDLRDTQRPSEFHGTKLRITRFTFLGKENAIFYTNEKLCFRIEYDAMEDLDGLNLYYTVKSIDGYTVGMTQTSRAFSDAKKGDHCIVDFSYDASNLAPGVYYFIPDIYSDDGTGRHLSYDHPLCNIAFEMVEPDNIKLRWQSNYYGHIRLNAIETVSWKRKE